jgi:exo-beta-1,3-glucanase (GH17 family)
MGRDQQRIVFAVAVGNEATVDWTDHFVPVERMIELVRRVKREVPQPVTFCENYVPWREKLRPLVRELDFISLHTYPVWEYKHVHDALLYSKDNYHSVASLYPDKPVVISEAGWATNSNGRCICPQNTSQELQAIYYGDLMDWTGRDGILTFVFEAFDEPWKGSPDPLEPEKHWGLFTVDRKPKRVMHALYPELL